MAHGDQDWEEGEASILTLLGNTAIIVEQLRTDVDHEIVSSSIGHF